MKFFSNYVVFLNKKLQQQISNKSQNLYYIKFDLDIIKLVIFINSLFVNNKNLLLQIYSYIICYTNTTNKTNIIYQFQIKFKQITGNVFITKLYNIAYRFDIRPVIKIMLKKILKFAFLLVLYIESKFLYNYLFNLNTIQKSN